MDEIWPRMEPDRYGVDLHHKGPRWRSVVTEADVTWLEPKQVTPEKEALVEKMFIMMTGGSYDWTPKDKKKSKK